MTLEKKAFRTVYRLIKNGQIDEKEAYGLVEAIFAINYQYVPVPTPITSQEDSVTDDSYSTVEVQGFAPLK